MAVNVLRTTLNAKSSTVVMVKETNSLVTGILVVLFKHTENVWKIPLIMAK
jgi:hypothetical protein